MSVIGRIALTAGEARALKDGAEFKLNQSRIVPARDRRPAIRDLIWVQEPFVEFEGRRDQTMFGFAYGSIPGLARPPHLKNVDCKVRVRGPEKMARSLSRTCLEVTAVIGPADGRASQLPTLIVTRVRAANVDALVTGGATT